MKKLLLAIVLFSTVNYSQHIFVCRGYTESGEPIDPITDGKIQTSQSVTILFSFSNSKFDKSILIVTIDKKTSYGHSSVESKLLYPDKQKDWISYNYKFSDEGEYEISFNDFYKKKLASTTLTVAKPRKKPSNTVSELSYYPKIRIIFCERIENSKPVKIVDKISFHKTNGGIYLYIQNDSPLRTNKLLLNVWRKKQINDNYEEFIDSKKYQINPSWQDAYFKLWFNEKGDYKINLFDEKELLIKTAYISVDY